MRLVLWSQVWWPLGGAVSAALIGRRLWPRLVFGLAHGRPLDAPPPVGAPLPLSRQHTRWIWVFLASCALVGAVAGTVGQGAGGPVLGVAVGFIGLGGLLMAWSDARERLIHDAAIATFGVGTILWRSQIRPPGTGALARLVDVGFGVIEGLVLAGLLAGMGWLVGRWKARAQAAAAGEDGPTEAPLALGEGDPPILFFAALGFGAGAGLGVMLGGAVFGLVGWLVVHRRHVAGHIPLVTHFMVALLVLLLLRAGLFPMDPVPLSGTLWDLWAPLWPATLR